MIHLPSRRYDIVVIGAGHAGCEAASAAGKLGCSVLLLALNLTRIAHMVCNPSLGGPGKAHLVSEIDALGGLMGRLADQNYLQVRVLNRSKGPAVQGLRVQADKEAYQRAMRCELEKRTGIHLLMDTVTGLIVDGGAVRGVRLFGGQEIETTRVILATGVHLDSRIVMGEERYRGGPAGGVTDNALSNSLRAAGLETARLQTATPPRIRPRSIDFSQLEELPFEEGVPLFAPESGPACRDQARCYSTRAGAATVEAVRRNLHRSPLVLGNIVDTGPRQCPSIDRKVINFPDKLDHQVFVEPEGREDLEVYLQGLSTGMAPAGQLDVIRSLPGFAAAEVSRFGYGIEYDFVPPRQLKTSLETRAVSGLFLAGQINGSSGYEEAAAQGLVAGINAARSLQGLPPLILPRHLSYIGVLIDDLVTKEHREPYRMLCSRAEFRLRLGQETAHHRLTALAYRLGLVELDRVRALREDKRRLYALKRCLHRRIISPTPRVNGILEAHNTAPIRKSTRLLTLFRRRDVGLELLQALGLEGDFDDQLAARVKRWAEIEGYLLREDARVRECRRLARHRLPRDFDPEQLSALSKPARDALKRFQPEDVGQAGRLQGVTPADLSVLLHWLAGKAAHAPR